MPDRVAVAARGGGEKLRDALIVFAGLCADGHQIIRHRAGAYSDGFIKRSRSPAIWKIEICVRRVQFFDGGKTSFAGGDVRRSPLIVIPRVRPRGHESSFEVGQVHGEHGATQFGRGLDGGQVPRCARLQQLLDDGVLCVLDGFQQGGAVGEEGRSVGGWKKSNNIISRDAHQPPLHTTHPPKPSTALTLQPAASNSLMTARWPCWKRDVGCQNVGFV